MSVFDLVKRTIECCIETRRMVACNLLVSQEILGVVTSADEKCNECARFAGFKMKVSINILWNDFNIPIYKEYSCTYEKLESFFPAFSPVRFRGWCETDHIPRSHDDCCVLGPGPDSDKFSELV